MSQAPKLNFRAKPLVLPAIRRDVENQLPKPPKPPKPKAPKPTPKVLDLSGVAPRPSDNNDPWYAEYSEYIEHARRVQCPQIRHQHVHWLAFPALFVLFVCLRVWLHGAEVHTIQSLTCKHSRRQVRCMGKPRGTFVVEVPPSCDSVYEIDGVPFSVAMRDGMFRVPAKYMIIKDVIDDCGVQAYLDSTPVHISMPFTWVTTAQHKKFTIHVDDQLVVDSAVAALFPSVKRGVWIAYTFDFPKDVTSIRVTGDGTDIIYTYEAR